MRRTRTSSCLPPAPPKAKSVLGQAIAALGGPAYLNLRNSACTARYAQFEKSGALGGFIQIRDYWEAPDKSRTEYDKKGNIVQVYAGDQGWTLDRGGVTEMDADSMADYQEQRRTALSTILRFRLNDDDLAFRYGGSDIEDLKQVDWVEIGDRDGHAIRVAIDKRTHLPVSLRRYHTRALDRPAYRAEHLLFKLQPP